MFNSCLIFYIPTQTTKTLLRFTYCDQHYDVEHWYLMMKAAWIALISCYEQSSEEVPTLPMFITGIFTALVRGIVFISDSKKLDKSCTIAVRLAPLPLGYEGKAAEGGSTAIPSA